MLPMLIQLLVITALGPGGMRSYKSKDANIRSNASAAESKALGKRIDHYCELFQEFYDELGMKKKNNNTLKVRLFSTYDEYENYYKHSGSGLGSTPLAYFSRSLNSIVMYSDEQDVALRAVVFHESSHQFLNRYTYDAPRWVNEGLAEYFEGWKVPEKGPAIRRPHLYDMKIVQDALKKGEYLSPEQLTGFTSKDFLDFSENHPKLNSYSHYATAWSVVYYGLTTGHEDDQDRMRQYIRDLRRKGVNAEFKVDDWEKFTQRWKRFIENLDPAATDATDHFLLATGYRVNREWVKAVSELELALKADPELPSANYWLGYCYKRTGQYTKAYEVLEQVMVDLPDDPRAPYYLARMHLGIDNKTVKPNADKALELIELASKLVDGESPLYFLLMARCYIAKGDNRRAKRSSKKMLKASDDESVEYWKQMTDVLKTEMK